MSTENVIAPTPEPVVNPTATPVPSSISSASLSELKVAFERALEERQKIDSRIEEIKTAVGERLSEAQTLNEAANSVSETIKPVTYRKTKKTVVVDSSDSDTKELDAVKRDSDSFYLDGAKLWKFFVNYVIPIALVAALVWLGVEYANQNRTDNSVVIPVSSIQTVDLNEVNV